MATKNNENEQKVTVKMAQHKMKIMTKEREHTENQLRYIITTNNTEVPLQI